ncbi:MAG: S8 family peptidase [Firmicutes bacterium]|jgi:serine protease AprX|nr:S8 family peptidase [Bacillota bacterium]
MFVDERWQRLYSNRLTASLSWEIFSARRARVQVIMEFSSYHQYCRSRTREAVRKQGGKILYELSLINSIAAELPANGLLELIPEAEPAVVWPDVTARSCLDVAVPASGAARAHRYGLTGKGVTVAVIDTGIDPHPDLVRPESRLAGWHDLVAGKPEPYDDDGHGTHVAGIIAGNGFASGGKYVGVAPGSLLVGVKVLDQDGGGPISRVIAGIQWVVENRKNLNIRVINLSLGAPAEKGYKKDPLSRAVEEAWRRGLVVCVAAGNRGPGEGTITTPGINPSVITVGSIDDQRTIPRLDDVMTDHSSRGPTVDELVKPDLVAPGARITSLKPGGEYTALTGTSMATPMVAGAAALILQKHPGFRPEQVKRLLLETAEDRGYHPLVQGAGYLDLVKALGLPPEEA